MKSKSRQEAKQPHVLGYLLSREEAVKVSGGHNASQVASVPTLETPGFVSNERLGQDRQ